MLTLIKLLISECQTRKCVFYLIANSVFMLGGAISLEL